jgi:hypothetical protein
VGSFLLTKVSPILWIITGVGWCCLVGLCVGSVRQLPDDAPGLFSLALTIVR